MGENCVAVCTALSVSLSLYCPEIEVSNDESLGSNVCINQTHTNSSLTGMWQFIFCPAANNSRSTSADDGGAKFCREYNERPGIGIDFPSGEATVNQLQLECESQSGTTLSVVDITVYFSEFLHTRLE